MSWGLGVRYRQKQSAYGLTGSRAKMKKWFEKWLAEKARRRDKGMPQVVDYRDVTYVSGTDDSAASRAETCSGSGSASASVYSLVVTHSQHPHRGASSHLATQLQARNTLVAVSAAGRIVPFDAAELTTRELVVVVLLMPDHSDRGLSTSNAFHVIILCASNGSDLKACRPSSRLALRSMCAVLTARVDLPRQERTKASMPKSI